MKGRDYLRWQMYSIQGFCSSLDARLLWAISIWQRGRISGDLIEVGVWHGKSFFILAGSRCDQERSIAIDPFQFRPSFKKQQIDEFRDNCRSFGVVLSDDEMIRRDS